MIGNTSSGITAPMNINAVIAHLVDMTPPQRKQFAQMHMDDPMMLSAAKFVDNQISKQAAAMSAQQMGTAPPPVNQQVVAQMSPQPPAPQAAPQPQATQQPQGQPMPEDTGIAQLPAQNMPSEYAAGGIVAFAEGDLVRGMPVSAQTAAMHEEMRRTGAAAGTGFRETVKPIGTGIVEGVKAAGSAISDVGSAIANADKNYLQAKIDRNETLTGVEKAQAVRAGLVLKDYQPPKVNYPLPKTEKNDRVKRDPANYAPAAAPKEKKGIEQLRQETIPATQAIPPSAAERPAQDLSLDRFMPAGAKRPGEADVEAANEARMKGAEEALSGFNADVAKRGKAMTEQEARIAVREATSKDRLDTNTNMSLINAGLAMMQSTGKGLAGIAEGAQVGTKQYQSGLREYDNAKEKLDSARDMIEQYRRTEDTLNDKERRAFTKNINDTRAAGLESLISFRTKIYGEDRADARSMLDMTVKQQEAAADRASAERRLAMSESGADRRNAASIAASAAAANRMPADVRAAQLLGGGDYEAGLRKMADIQAGKFNPMTAYIQHYLPGVSKAQSLDPSVQAKSFPQFKAMLGMDVTRP